MFGEIRAGERGCLGGAAQVRPVAARAVRVVDLPSGGDLRRVNGAAAGGCWPRMTAAPSTAASTHTPRRTPVITRIIESPPAAAAIPRDCRPAPSRCEPGYRASSCRAPRAGAASDSIEPLIVPVVALRHRELEDGGPRIARGARWMRATVAGDRSPSNVPVDRQLRLPASTAFADPRPATTSCMATVIGTVERRATNAPRLLRHGQRRQRTSASTSTATYRHASTSRGTPRTGEGRHVAEARCLRGNVEPEATASAHAIQRALYGHVHRL